jgi:small subunit ribosomal protein S3
VGQKVHPYGFRLGFNKTWRSRWFSSRDYQKLLHEDLRLRPGPQEALLARGVSRHRDRARGQQPEDRHLHLAPGHHHRPQGNEVEKLKQEIQKRTSRVVFINIQEIQKPELEAQLISESVAVQLEKRVAFRRAMRKAVESALRSAPRHQGARVGRLNGAEIARSSGICTARLPLQTLRATSTTGLSAARAPTLRPRSA